MQTLHDPIAAKANQFGCYSSIKVSHLQMIIDIPCHSDFENFQPDLIRITEYELLNGKELEFLRMQKKILDSNIPKVRGMIGGYVWQTEQTSRYLVTTFWEYETMHEIYTEECFTIFNKGADAPSNIKKLSDHTIKVKDCWVVGY